MTYEIKIGGFLVPAPTFNPAQWPYRLAYRARALLVERAGIGSSTSPLADVASRVAVDYCSADWRATKGLPGWQPAEDRDAASWLEAAAGDPHAAAWLAGCLVEILSLDDCAQAWLQQHGLPSRSARKAPRKPR